MDEKTLQLIAECERSKIWQRFGQLFTLKNTMPVIQLNRRLKTTAGRCNLDARIVELAPVMFAENVEAYKQDIIPHEIAHMVAWDVYRDNGHGYHWKSVMLAYGLEPSRCHSLTTSAMRIARAKKGR
jgi:SprT protein